MRRAAKVLGITAGLDVLLGMTFGLVQHIGIWDGLYFATTTATTVGYGDITPHGVGPHLIAVAMMLSIVPLYASVFSLITTGLTTAHLTQHIDNRHEEVKQHVSDVLGKSE